MKVNRSRRVKDAMAAALGGLPREPLPRHVAPMTGLLAALPADPQNWAFEYKWDGVRAIAFLDGKSLRLDSRNLLDVTGQYPELGSLAGALRGVQAVLDGEIVALDVYARPSFGLLQQRMHVTNKGAIARLVREVPVFYMIFDVLHLAGRSTRGLPYLRRREILLGLRLDVPEVAVPAHELGRGKEMLDSARRIGLEGVMAKRVGSPYEEGRRSPNWLKVKLTLRQEFVIGGYTPGKGGLVGGLGSLLVGYYDLRREEAANRRRPQVLHYAGSVGTGFTARTNAQVLQRLEKMRTDRSPFAEGNVRPEAMYVRPQLLAEVEFRAWTHDGILRQPAFKGLRGDKAPRDVVKE